MLPRGFKADAERRAITLRAEMGLGPADALELAGLMAEQDVAEFMHRIALLPTGAVQGIHDDNRPVRPRERAGGEAAWLQLVERREGRHRDERVRHAEADAEVLR